MSKLMLIDATPGNDVRVAVTSNSGLEDFDYESPNRNEIKGNIYLAKVIRIEPSLQACFVDYGHDRHGFLAFGEIHPDYYRIPVEDREALIAEQEAENARRAAREASEMGDDDDDGDDTHGDHPHVKKPRRSRKHHDDDTRDNAARDDDGDANGSGDEEHSEHVASDDNSDVDSEADKPVRRRRPSRRPTKKTNKDDTASADSEPNSGDSQALSMHTPERSADLRDDDQGSDDDQDEGQDAAYADGNGDSDDDERDDDQRDDRNESSNRDEQRNDGGQPRYRFKRRYKIQEVIKKGQIMLVQAVKEERGNKCAAFTTYLSVPGRYCVLMPNTPNAGGISRKINQGADRKRIRAILKELELGRGMSVIVRTAGKDRSKVEIKRDFDYIMRLWEEIRDDTLKATAPARIYSEGDAILRSIRDTYDRDIDEVVVAGDEAFKRAKAIMKSLMPSHVKRVKHYDDPIPLFHRYGVEYGLEKLFNPTVKLKSGGYLVIHPTEALVAIDVNSGRSTRERNIEETALKTNLEAAEEVARQLRLRDLAGLIVIDFIDMMQNRNVRLVEQKVREAFRHDRARVQIGRMSQFGLLELSRQRLRRSLMEMVAEPCPSCRGTGLIPTPAFIAMRLQSQLIQCAIGGYTQITVRAGAELCHRLMNQQRGALAHIEQTYKMIIHTELDITLLHHQYVLIDQHGEEVRLQTIAPPPLPVTQRADHDEDDFVDEDDEHTNKEAARDDDVSDDEQPRQTQRDDEDEDTDRGEHPRRRRRGRRGGRGRGGRRDDVATVTDTHDDADTSPAVRADGDEDHDDEVSPSSSRSAVAEQSAPAPMRATTQPDERTTTTVVESPRPSAASTPPSPPKPDPNADVIVIDEATGQPKKGWWSRLVK